MSGILKARNSIEYNRKYDSTAPEHNSNTCKKLPSNCYCETYLEGLTCTEKLMMEIKTPEDDLPNITNSLDSTCWFD